MDDSKENLDQERKIDKLQYQMEGVQGELKELKSLSKETNNRLEAMQKGFVGREEYREHQILVGKLATQKDVDSADKALAERIASLEGWQTWAIRIALGVVIVSAVTAALLATK